jgi:integrase
MSAHAMDEPTLKRLLEFAWSTEQKEYGPISHKRKAENPSEWAGFSLRMMLYLLYLLSMLCLLRYDEALRITWADVTFQIQDLVIENHWLDVAPELFAKQVNYRPVHFQVKLKLPFRKTHQYGGH